MSRTLSESVVPLQVCFIVISVSTLGNLTPLFPKLRQDWNGIGPYSSVSELRKVSCVPESLRDGLFYIVHFTPLNQILQIPIVTNILLSHSKTRSYVLQTSMETSYLIVDHWRTYIVEVHVDQLVQSTRIVSKWPKSSFWRPFMFVRFFSVTYLFFSCNWIVTEVLSSLMKFIY